MPSFRLSKRAAADIDEILAFTIERWGVEQAGKYLGGLDALFHIVASRPMMGRRAAQIRPDLRRIEHVSHIVFYKTLPQGISIERVLHKSKALKKSDFKP
jgi:toxin ParE1/3/4